MASEPDPPWLRDAARAVGHEIVAWLRDALRRRAVAGALRRRLGAGERRRSTRWPSRSTRWPWSGRGGAVGAAARPDQPTTPLWFELRKPALPVIINLGVTRWFHVLARAVGGRRPLRSSMARRLRPGGPLEIVQLSDRAALLYSLSTATPPVGYRMALANLAQLILFFVYSSRPKRRCIDCRAGGVIVACWWRGRRSARCRRG